MAPARKDRRTINARRLRREATPPEKPLWMHLKQMDVPGGHFCRQAPMGPYFADFVHFGAKLVIDLDGNQHGLPNVAARDERRTAYLETQGFRVLRFWNHELAENLDGVVEMIFRAVHDISNPIGDTEC